MGELPKKSDFRPLTNQHLEIIKMLNDTEKSNRTYQSLIRVVCKIGLISYLNLIQFENSLHG